MATLIQVSISLWLVCMLIPMMKAAQTKHCRTSEYSHPTGICGNNLSEMLSLVCEGRGFFEPFGKRSEALDSENTISDELTSEVDIPLSFPFISKSDALQILDKRGETIVIDGITYRTGVTCECCVNKCRWRELDQYCLIPAKKKSAGPLSHLFSRGTNHVGDSLFRFRTKHLV